MRKFLALALATTMTVATTGMAHANAVIAQNPDSVVKALQKAGFRAELNKDSAGDPMIESAASGTNFAVLFYGCTEHRNCGRIQFVVTFTGYKNTSLEALNEWNAKNYFGRSYRTDKGAARLEMDLDLDDGGISAALFEDNVEWWTTIMANFEKHINQDG